MGAKTALADKKSSEPIRLRIAYKTPQALLGEFTRSVGKGAVALMSRKTLPVGTRFVFEMYARNLGEPIEVHGEVVSVSPAGGGNYSISIRYDGGQNQRGLDKVLSQVLEAHRYEKVRKHPRIPLNLRATEEAPYSPAYVVRDISRGGVGIEVEAPEVPKTVRIGTPFLIEMSLSLGKMSLFGEVMWTFAPPPDRVAWVSPAFGVKFGKLQPQAVALLEKILALRGLPPPPWKAVIAFGMDAVGRMP